MAGVFGVMLGVLLVMEGLLDETVRLEVTRVLEISLQAVSPVIDAVSKRTESVEVDMVRNKRWLGSALTKYPV